MAADETKQPSKQRVVEMVKASRNRKGAYQADYNCPACRAPLVSLDDTLLGTETCPNCHAAFVFGPAVQAGYRAHKAAIERAESDAQRVAAQRELLTEAREQAAEAERQRLAEVERSLVKRKIAENRERDQRIAARRTDVRGVEFGIAVVQAIALAGNLVLIIVGIFFLWSDNPLRASAAQRAVALGCASLVSLLFVQGFFSCLFAIHQLLSDISEKLDRRA